MTIWEFACARSGFAKANTSGEQPAPELSDDRMSELGIEGF